MSEEVNTPVVETPTIETAPVEANENANAEVADTTVDQQPESKTVLSGEEGEKKPAANSLNADDYKVEVEGIDFEEFKSLEKNKVFLGKVAELGVSNEALNYLVGEFNERAKSLLDEGSSLATEDARASLSEVWGNDVSTNIAYAQKALKAAGFTDEELSKPEVGNSVALAKLAAHFGKQMSEDVAPGAVKVPSSTDINALLSHQAYNNPSHPEHDSVMKQITAYYQSVK